MATFLRGIRGNYINVDHIIGVQADRDVECYEIYATGLVELWDGEMGSSCFVSPDIWLGYLGVPPEEQAARFEEDMGLAEVHE